MSTVDDDVRHALSRLILGGFHGHDVPDDFQRLVDADMVDGAILFSRNIESLDQTAELVARLKGLRPQRPLWMAIDQEGGRVQRLKAPFPQLPPMRQLGAREDADALVQRAATILGAALSTLGFDQDYAPVLDVDTNPDNPVIGDRSLARSPEAVAALGARFIEALQATGVAACGKHFPGHGDTNVDSHLALPRLDHDLERLRSVELVPFEAAARAQVATIMTAHVVFAPLDDEHPATLSEHVLVPVLRRELGYQGVIVSDDLEMRAVADHYGTGDAAVRAIRCGCDQLLICSRTDLAQEAYEALRAAAESDPAFRARVLEAAGRVDAMRARFDPDRQPRHDADQLAALTDEWANAWA